MPRPTHRSAVARRTRVAVVALLCLCAIACPAEPAPKPAPAPTPTQMDGAGLVADVDLLERAYTTLHPGLYRYSTPAQTSRRFDALREQLQHGASLAQAYLAFSRFAATVRCGHTYANFYNQSPAVQQALFTQGRGRLPFYFRWLDGRMVITRNGSRDASLTAGTLVLAIDDVPAATILERLMPLARADGGNDAKRVAQLQVLGEDRFETFDIFLPLAFAQFGDRLRLRVQGPGDDAAREVTVDGLSADERDAMREVARRNDDDPGWRLDFPRPDVAVLRMPNWALYESRWDWRGFLDASFARLDADKTATLVIDVRGNEGGLSVGDELLAHLTERPLPGLALRQLVRYRSVPPDLRPYLKTWDASFKDWGDDAKPFDDRYFRLTRWQKNEFGDAIAPKAPRYAGKVYVLIGATNSSATFEFAQQAKAGGLATLVGQTTGGNRRGINGSAFFFLKLPNSGIELDIPLVGQFPVTAQADAGVTPDVPVQVTPEDIAAGRDAELDTVLALSRASAQ